MSANQELDVLKFEIQALWALIMGHLAGQDATCYCCDVLSEKDDQKREAILDIFRRMGFDEAIQEVTHDYFTWLNQQRRSGKWFGWPFKTLSLVQPELLERLLKEAPKILEKRVR